MDAVGIKFAAIATKSQASTGGSIVSLGGDDTITAQDGTKIVLGGDGADTIKLGDGRALSSNHIVIGDNGVVNYVPIGQTGAGLPWIYETTDTLAVTGGVDTIKVGDGDNTILGGMGGDAITTDTGTAAAARQRQTDTIIGDNGIVEMDAEGNNFARIATKSQASTGGSIVDLGGDDVIVVGVTARSACWAATERTRWTKASAREHRPHGDRRQRASVTYVGIDRGVGWRAGARA